MGRRAQPASEGLGRTLFDEMIARGYNQRELARRAGIPQSAVSQIITGKRSNPTATTLYALEHALELEPGSLMRMVPADKTRASLERFLASPIAKSLNLQPDDLADLETRRWYGPHEDPPDEAWIDFVRARRGVRQRAQNKGPV